MSARPPAVVLCADLAAGGVNLDEVRGALRARFPGVSVTIVPDVCRRPGAATSAIRAAGGGRAVVGACRRLPLAEVRGALRSVSAGPFDVAVVRVPRTRGATVATTTVAAALERLARLPGAEPFRRVPIAAGLRRGALLRIAPALGHEPVAVVDEGRCAGGARCGVCAGACPAQAIAFRGGVARITAADCDACGRCVAACPRAAIHLAGAAPGQLEAQLATLVEAPGLGVAFACASAQAALEDEGLLDGWRLVEVPALRVLSPGSVAGALLAGAPRVCVCPCDGDCCAPWREGGAALDLCRRLLGAGARARLLVAPPPSGAALEAVTPPEARLRTRLSEPGATVAAVAALAHAPAVRHPGSPLGLVDVAAGCTLCSACAVACPAGALTVEEDDRGGALRFDPRLCTGCGLCAAACPEAALTVTRGIDPARLAAGPADVFSVEARRCRGCGERLAAPAVVARARAVLAAARPELAEAPADLCLACAAAGGRAVCMGTAGYDPGDGRLENGERAPKEEERLR